jgi:predicted GNAT family N-acyltransferase
MNEMSKDELSLTLSRFKCSRNKDSEYFLRKIALKHETRGISRTYLAIDTDKDNIMGYFTLALKCLNVDGLNIDPAIIDLMNPNEGVAQAYLIGQLARSDDAERGTGKNMLDDALNLFAAGKGMFGCRTVRLDCKDELIDYYRSHGFKHMRKNVERDLNQMAIFI